MIGLLLEIIGFIQYIIMVVVITPFVWLATHVFIYLWDFIKWLFVQLCWLLEWIVKKLYWFVKWVCNKIAAKINAARNQA